MGDEPLAHVKISIPSWNSVLSREKKKPLILKSGLPGEGSLGTSPKVLREKQGSEGEEMNTVSLPASCVTKQKSAPL